MPDWKHYKASRQRRVELPGGYRVLLRQPDLRRVLATTPLEPALLATQALLLAAGESPVSQGPENSAGGQSPRRSASAIALSQAHYADYLDLTCAVLCECCLEPRFYLDAAAAQAAGGVWIHDLAPGDVARLEQAAWGLLQLEVSEAKQLAPFRQPAGPGAQGATLADAAEQAATEFAAATA